MSLTSGTRIGPYEIQELYYLSPAGAMMAVPMAAAWATLTPGQPSMLFPTRIVDRGRDHHADSELESRAREALTTVYGASSNSSRGKRSVLISPRVSREKSGP